MIATGFTVTVYADDTYRYEVGAVDSELSITYIEDSGLSTALTFGSSEEMEAVALAMLQVVKLSRQ